MTEASWRREQAPQSRRVNKCAGHDEFSGSRSASPVVIRAGSLRYGGIVQSGRWSGDACVAAQPISLGWLNRWLFMDSEPVAKCDHKRRVGSRIRNRHARANPASNEMMMKEFHSELGVVANLSALEMRASATPKMAGKGIKHGEIDILQGIPFPLNEAAEMRRGSDVSNGA